MISFGSGNVLKDNIQGITTEVISNLPKILNDHQEKNLMYSVMSAYVIMCDSNLLASKFEFSEKMPYTVFSSDGRQLLEHTIRRLEDEGDFLAIYTCEPYSLIIGLIDHQLVAADTHAIPLQCDGHLNGQIRVYDPSNKRSCHMVCCWLWCRLSESGAKSTQGQSFAVATKVSSDLQASGEKDYYKTVKQMLKQHLQTYDGTNNMLGKKSGVAPQIQKDQPKAISTHCHGHPCSVAKGFHCVRFESLYNVVNILPPLVLAESVAFGWGETGTEIVLGLL